MKINYIKGNKTKRDRIIKITSDYEEWFSIFKLALLTNQIAINEKNIQEDQEWEKFIFKPAIIDSIEMAEQGIDWAQEENKSKVLNWCKKHHIKFEWIEPELRKCWQTKLEDFENENP